MSKYREIKTEFRNLDSLKRALWDVLGTNYSIAVDCRKPDLPMYGYHNDLREEKASIVINREWVNDHWSGTKSGSNYYRGISNDIGFAWDGNQYSAIVSDYDQSRQGVTEAMNKLRQRYGFHEVQRLARAKGYTVRETATDNSGQIRLVLVRR